LKRELRRNAWPKSENGVCEAADAAEKFGSEWGPDLAFAGLWPLLQAGR
jgi:hypothetical protein